MNILNIPYNKMFLIDENKSTNQRVYFEKSFFSCTQTDQYFIKLCKKDSNNNYVCQGYIYFYLDFINRESNFIGLFVKPEYRNEGLAQLLISYWMKLCLENGIYDLNTIHRQRKPFILYLLKKFRFELLNSSEYITSPNTISICKDTEIGYKFLFFKNPKQAESFINGKIYKGDNHLILDSLTEKSEVLDQVLLSTIYNSEENNAAYQKSLTLIDRFKIN